MQRLALFSVLVATVLAGGFAISQNPNTATLRQEAQRLQKEGNSKDALDRYRKILAVPNEDGPTLARDFEAAISCLNQLQLQSEIDDWIELVIKTNPKSWRVHAASANVLVHAFHNGVVQGKKFIRYPTNFASSGVYVDRSEQDRQFALQLFAKAIPMVEKEPSGAESARFYLQLAQALSLQRSHQQAWRLQEKTDLSTPVDYLDLEAPQGHAYRSASVDEQGQPIFFQNPKSWEAANSDGERYRWALMQAREMDPAIGEDAMNQWAQFLHSQFGVETLYENPWMIRSQAGDGGNEQSVLAIHTLADEETLAKLASGIKRFALPDDQNPIKVYQELAKSTRKQTAESALMILSQIYLNRRQFPKAVEVMQQSLKRFGDSQRTKQSYIDGIVQPRGSFDPMPTQLAGKPAKLSLVFRNARVAEFKAHQVDLEKILADTKSHYQMSIMGNPMSFGGVKDSMPPQFEFPGNLFEGKDLGKYASKEVAAWQWKLEPRDHHWDRRIEVETPLKKPGLYVVTAQFDKSENEARCLVWVQDTALLRRTLDGKEMYYVADAESGNALANVNVEFFGIQHNPNQVRGNKVYFTKSFVSRTDAQGKLILGPKEMDTGHQWFAIARDGKGRLATLGLEWISIRNRTIEQFEQLRAFGITDRPAYRPGDKVHAKLWIARASYAPDLPGMALASQKFHVKVVDPQGQAIHESTITTDSYGGAEIDIATDKKTMLGVYGFQVMQSNDLWIECPLRFRLEEYRKPEFEVNIVAPDKPVALGETIRATVRAKYYFGSPVNEATATIRVQRTIHTDRYYPVAPYDWCYGPGYWWFAYDYEWFPGWQRWAGCRRPAPWWIGFGAQEPPELILEKEIKLDASGEAKIEIDTAIAKAFQGNQDHQYAITVEVRDASRRTIDASGLVIAARQPFRIYTWLDRGFYRVGEKVIANFHARTPGGEPVSAKGKLELRRIQYDKDLSPTERVVQSWDVQTDGEGKLEHLIQGAESGQYRLRLVLTDQGNHEVEGAYVFTIRGDKDKPGDFRFNEIELITDKQHYQPKDKLKLQINANRADAKVLLFVRPQMGVYPEPQFISLDGKSKVVEIEIASNDQPNFFIEATTIFDGKVHTAIREVLVPPEKRVLNVKAIPNKSEYKPGEEATVDLEITDALGKPTAASAVLAIYDRAVEAISSDTIPGDIREFFWKWRRSHFSEEAQNLNWQTWSIAIHGVSGWFPLGMFGNEVADDSELLSNRGTRTKPGMKQMLRGPASMPGGAARGMGGAGGAMAEGMAMDVAAYGGVPGAPPAVGTAGNMAPSDGAPSAGPDNAAPMAPTTVRKDFADTALWLGLIQTDATGRATKKFKLPENTTSWKLRTWAMGEGVRVGSDAKEAVTRKNLLVRLQAPRFLVQRDQCVISSLVNNDLAEAVDVKVRLEIDGETQLRIEPGEVVEKTIRIESHSQSRVDWKCQAIAEGEVTLRTIAGTSLESDAMQIKLPILINGILKTDSLAGTIRRDQSEASAKISVPEARRIDQSRLVVRLSPSLAASMVDALPYLAEYPYGCTEQTLNRFLPTVITQKVLLEMRVDLEKIAARRNNLNAQELGKPEDRSKQWKRFERNPVFDKKELDLMVQEGLRRLAEMQCSDGGWGWFSGRGEHSWPHTTAMVVRGLKVAEQNDVAMLPGMIERGLDWLWQYQEEQLQKLKNAPSMKTPYKQEPDNLDALLFQILVESGRVQPEMQEILYEKRQSLSVYGLALLGLGTHQTGNLEQTRMIRQNIEQFLVEDPENETAFLRNASPWWYWYGSEMEGTAAYLKLLAKMEPKGRIAPRLVKHLLNKRKNATYWSSTRDTAYVIEAFADYIRASGETTENVNAEVYLNNARLGAVSFTPDNLFDVDNTIAIEGSAVPSGVHQLQIRRTGNGPIYWNAYSTHFTLEEEIPAAGLEVRVHRRFVELIPVKRDLTMAGDRGQLVQGERSGFQRREIQDLNEVKSGSTIEVELTVESKNDYEYLLLEDSKPATLEPIDTQSGYVANSGLSVYREFRDQKVSFFIRQLPQGTHSFRYRLRAESPGTFTALPSIIQGMYAPELVGNSTDSDFKTVD